MKGICLNILKAAQVLRTFFKKKRQNRQGQLKTYLTNF